MKRSTIAMLGAIAFLAAIAAWAVTGSSDRLGPRPEAERAPLALITSLPLLFGEEFGLDNGGSPALTRLEQRYNILPVGVADQKSLQGKSLLLMAHPRAQPADVLVQLDQWVQGGGKLLLLADPKLDWPSSRPFGDKLRPQPAFADTGLLQHWGLKLSGPEADGSDTRGHLASTGKCIVVGGGMIARCSIGRGWVTVIADADFLNVDDSEADNLSLLVGELNRLESR
ncbi:GldG family protein [Sphingomonas sp. NSE70-1]|uniref:GldG family protein n=1 Tax=Sphingomonas caseinilyticus TaxID=2908205 RepID=A0ABT0RWH7_9SPHN|nr:GldG family protein [Sphingomonas caseinilyticus]MCL6699355.1 GldG family protein [Sphingomonas caseinilyticus]